MGHGRVNIAQARAIWRRWSGCRRPVSSRSAPSSARQRRPTWSSWPRTTTPRQLRILGRHIFEVIAPDLAEEFEGRVLEAEEAQARRRTTFTMWEDDEGTCHGRFRIPSLHGQMLEKMILVAASRSRATPRRLGAGGIDPDLPTPVRHGIAFTQLLESIRPRACRRPAAARRPWW